MGVRSGSFGVIWGHPGGPPLDGTPRPGETPGGVPRGGPKGGHLGSFGGGPRGSFGVDLRGGSKMGSFLGPFSLRGLAGGLKGQIQDLRFGQIGPNSDTRFRGIPGFGRSPKHPKSTQNGYFGVSFLGRPVRK